MKMLFKLEGMDGMKAPYQTRQQNELLEYLQKTQGEHHTAAQIRDHFASSDHPIGTVTIYRQLERLTEAGVVRKYTLGEGISACYEYVGQANECTSHFHCKCEQCGRLIHVDCDMLEKIRTHLLQEHGFAWNAGKTVFYGICDQCRTV